MKTRLKQGFTLIELLVVITIIAILASLAVPTFSKIQERGNMTKGISNCRQIITTLRIYSADNNGNYPDTNATAGGGTGGGAVATANAAFRELFIGGQVSDEKIFGCPSSLNGNPDGNIGTSPAYAEAVAAGENHWALTAGLNDSASGSIPVVFENATSAGGFDPTWDVKAAGRNTRGRTWGGGKVIVGMNDSSVSPLTCDLSSGKLKAQGTGKNVFAQAGDTSGSGAAAFTILDILPKS